MVTVFLIIGVILFGVFIVFIANKLDTIMDQKRMDLILREQQNGTYDPNKRYFGVPGWVVTRQDEPSESAG